MRISGSVKGTEVTVSFSWHFLQHFFIIWGHLLPSGAMMDSRYCSFLPIPPSQCPDLSTAVSCDLASQCAVQVLMTSATSGVLSGRDWERGRDTDMIFPHVSIIQVQVEGIITTFLWNLFLEWTQYTGLLQFTLLKASIQKKKCCADWYHQGMFSNSHANCRGGGGFPSAVLYGYLTANCLNKPILVTTIR